MNLHGIHLKSDGNKIRFEFENSLPSTHCYSCGPLDAANLLFLYNLYLLFAASQIHTTGNGIFLMQAWTFLFVGLLVHPAQQQPFMQQQCFPYLYDPLGQTPLTSALNTAEKERLLAH